MTLFFKGKKTKKTALMHNLTAYLKKLYPKRRTLRNSADTALYKSIRNVALASLILSAILVGGTLGFVLIEDWSILDSLWMTVITMSTVGFGDVVPPDSIGRILTIAIIISTILVGGYAVGNIGAFFLGGEVINILRGRKLERDLDRCKDHVILVGYGRVGREAASELTTDEIVVIERDPDIIEEAADAGFLTINGDATHDNIMEQAGIRRARAIMIATGHIADNVLISLTARELNPDIFISARGNEPSSESKLKRAGADKVVLPHQIGGRRMAAFLKYPTVVTFLDLVMQSDDLSLRLQEFKVSDTCCLNSKTLSESDIRKETGGALIMAIKRHTGEMIVAPESDYSIEAGDLLIALGTDVALENVCKLTNQ
ncbi:MAG: NAD-binding protein [Candidatus Hatepunaea meridiana]|nr:NAD-binding protein [Candidatus Hatepunaea meridiana]